MDEPRSKSTKTILGEGNFNFKVWENELYLLLCEYDLENYIEEEILKKIDITSINKNDLNKHKKVRGDKRKVYSLNTKDKDIKNDIKVKNILMNSVCLELKTSIDFKSNTAYEIYNIIQKTYKHSKEDRKNILENKLSNLYFNEEENCMSLYIASLNNIFTELSNLGVNKTDREKFDYLFNSIPQNLAVLSNLIQHCDDWDKCCDVIIEVHQHLKNLQEKKNKKPNNNKNTNNSVSLYSHSRKQKKPPRCQICKKLGHTAVICRYRNSNTEEKDKDNNNDYNNKKWKKDKRKPKNNNAESNSTVKNSVETENPEEYVNFGIEYDSDAEEKIVSNYICKRNVYKPRPRKF